MHGNVWEWCQDAYKPYEDLTTKNTLETENMDANARVLRGGSWYCDAWRCRAANRNRCAPGGRFSDDGFRVAFRLD